MLPKTAGHVRGRTRAPQDLTSAGHAVLRPGGAHRVQCDKCLSVDHISYAARPAVLCSPLQAIVDQRR